MPNITTTLTTLTTTSSHIQLTRPEKKNALTPAMYDTLR